MQPFGGSLPSPRLVDFNQPIEFNHPVAANEVKR
jgi:hypothetical protein